MPSLSPRPLSALAGAVALLLVSVTPADARPPRGYNQWVTASFVVPAGQQVRHELPCPDGKVALGGGAAFDEPGIARDINSSFPSAAGWTADINNRGPV